MNEDKSCAMDAKFSLTTPRVSSVGNSLHSPRVSKNSLPLKVRVRGALYAQIVDLGKALEQYRKMAIQLKDEFGHIHYRDGDAMLSLNFWMNRRASGESTALRWRWGFIHQPGSRIRAQQKKEVFVSQSFYEVMASPAHPQHQMVSEFLNELHGLGQERVRQVFSVEKQRIEINNLILECRLAMRNAERLVGDMELENKILGL